MSAKSIVILVLLVSTTLNLNAAVRHGDYKNPLLSVSRDDKGIYTYQYKIESRSNQKIDMVALDVGLPSLGAGYPNLRDKGLSVGLCAVNAKRSTRYNLSYEIGHNAEMLFEKVSGASDLLSSVPYSNRAMHNASLASWLPAIKNQSADIDKLLNIIMKASSEYSNESNVLNEQDNHAIKQIIDNTNFIISIHDEIRTVYSDNLTINKMAALVESFVSQVKGLNQISKSFYHSSWHQRIRIPVVATTLDNDLFECAYKDDRDVLFQSSDAKKAREINITLESYGKPGLRRYVVGYKKNNLGNTSMHYGWTVGPTLLQAKSSIRGLVTEFVQYVHVSYREGWIVEASVANSLIAKVNELLSKVHESGFFEKKINSLYSFLEENRCKNSKACDKSEISNAAYNVLTPRLESVENLIKKTM